MGPITPNESTRHDAPAGQGAASRGTTFQQRLEYFAVRGILTLLGWLPRPLARSLCAMFAALSYWFWPRLRRVGLFNLRLVFPEKSEREIRKNLSGLFQNLGRMLADFAHFPRLNRGNIERLIIYDGFENYARAQSQGKGVLFL